MISEPIRKLEDASRYHFGTFAFLYDVDDEVDHVFVGLSYGILFGY